MNLTEFCLKKPVLVIVSVVFLLLAGIWALFSIPIQLTPDVETPKITVRTYWPGASPYEVEREIVQRQEEFLNNLPNLVRMRSTSQPGRGNITLEFEIGTSLDESLLRITNELNKVPSYPENSLRPNIILSGASSSPIIWSIVRTLPGNERSIRTYKSWVEDVIRPEIEKLPGISEVRVYGGRNAEMQIRLDPAKLSLHGISIKQFITRVRSDLGNVSGGTITDGKREYTVRTVSPFKTPSDLEMLILKSTAGGAVYIKDVAEVELGYSSQGSAVLSSEGRAMVLPIYKEPGANVLEITEAVKATIARLNNGILKEHQLRMQTLSDPGYYINSAIDLVLQNIYLGGFLSIMVLFLFLGNLRSALVVALTIPVSIIGTFLFMKLLGRNINVISLAGLAFSVGMVMDAAIVVLENIDKWRARGNPLFTSVVNATREVYGAILASALTTVAVFLPVVFVQDQAGQLFKDIAIAICVAIILSFIISTTVIPPLYNYLFSRNGGPGTGHTVNPLTRRLQREAAGWVDSLIRLLRWLQAGYWRKVALVAGTLALAVGIALVMTPRQEYLPSGNRNLILSILFPPLGYSPKEKEALGREILAEMGPAIRGEVEGVPKIGRVFFVGFGTRLVLGVVSEEPGRVKELIPHIKQILAKVPGMLFVTSQTSLFSRGLAAGRSIDVEIYGDKMEDISGIAQRLFSKIPKLLPGSQVRPIPPFELSQPEIRVIPNLERAAAAGLSVRDIGLIVDIYTDGRKISEFSTVGGESLDLRLLVSRGLLGGIHEIAEQPLLAPNGRYVNLGSVAEIIETSGPVQINRIGEGRAFTLRVSPPKTISLEEVLEILSSQLVQPALAENAAVPGLRIAMTGTADAFTKTRQSLQTGFVLAVAITFLLLVILFEDLLSPFVIIAMLPVAGAGGLIGLGLINLLVTEQALDMLTMLGFLMMIGIVVNNPILIVSKALSLMREEGEPLVEAVLIAVRLRIRPIFMTTFTSVGGLLPLVLMPGAGSELYRGLGSAVLGGLMLSTFVNMLFVPTLFCLIQDSLGFFKRRGKKEESPEPLTSLARTHQ